MKDLFAIARNIVTAHDPDIGEMVKDLSTQELTQVWLIVNGYYCDSKLARGAAEAREIDLMIKMSKLNEELQERL